LRIGTFLAKSNLLTIREVAATGESGMTTTVEFDGDRLLLPDYQTGEIGQPIEEHDDALALAAVYQQIADRRAQLENADILRRARAL
jgi:hypothetical protein